MAHTIALANKPRESLMKKITGSVKLTKETSQLQRMRTLLNYKMGVSIT